MRFETPHPLNTTEGPNTFLAIGSSNSKLWLPMFILLFTVDRETAYVTNHDFVKSRLRPRDTTQRLNMCVCATVCVCVYVYVLDYSYMRYEYYCTCMHMYV